MSQLAVPFCAIVDFQGLWGVNMGAVTGYCIVQRTKWRFTSPLQLESQYLKAQGRSTTVRCEVQAAETKWSQGNL